jgi:hypothetical protein
MKKVLFAVGLVSLVSSDVFADGKFYDEVRNAVIAVRTDKTVDAGNKAEVSISKAFAVPLDDQIIFLSRQTDGSIYIVHSNSHHNGQVKNDKEIKLYNQFFDAIKSDTKEATVEAANVDGEKFTWEVTEVDDNSIVVCRHN